jgi:hypothetical protein
LCNGYATTLKKEVSQQVPLPKQPLTRFVSSHVQNCNRDEPAAAQCFVTAKAEAWNVSLHRFDRKIS